MKQIIKLNETDIHKIVRESVKAIVNEGVDLKSQYTEIMDKLYELEKLLVPFSRHDNRIWTPFREFCNAVENYIRENPAI